MSVCPDAVGFGPLRGAGDLTRCFEDAVLFAPLQLAVIVGAVVFVVQMRGAPMLRTRRSVHDALNAIVPLMLVVVQLFYVIAEAALRQFSAVSFLHYVLNGVLFVMLFLVQRRCIRCALQTPVFVRVLLVLLVLVGIVKLRTSVLVLQTEPGCVECGASVANFIFMLLLTVMYLVPRSASVFKPLVPDPTEPGYYTFKSGEGEDAEQEDNPLFGSLKRSKSGYREYFRDVLGLERGLVAVGVLLSLVSAGCNILTTVYSGKIVDAVQSQQSLGAVTGILAGAYILHGLCIGLTRIVMLVASARITSKLRMRLYGHILDQDMLFFDRSNSGELLNRILSDVAATAAFVSPESANMFANVLALFGALIYLFSVSWRLTLIMMAPLILMVLFVVLQGSLFENLGREIQNRLGGAQRAAEDALINFSLVRTSCNEELEMRNYRRSVERVFDVQWRLSALRGFFDILIHMSVNLALVLGMWFGAQMTQAGELTPGGFVAYILFAVDIVIHIGLFPALLGELAVSIGKSDRVFSILEHALGMKLDADSPPLLQGEIDFANVLFYYFKRQQEHDERGPPERKVALDRVTFNVPAGTTAAFVGESGSGKSTILQLVQRMYDTTSGNVLIDKLDVANMAPSMLREQVGVVAQEPTLFMGTIRDNITYGAFYNNVLPPRWTRFPWAEAEMALPQAPAHMDAEVEQAARLANAFEFIDKRPGRFDAEITERGGTLSGGQKQRIAIARALMRRPHILVLDEATSALDAESERVVQDALDRVLTNERMTKLVVAHRLTTVRHADTIFVMRGGRLVEQGSYDALMQKNGEFARLVRRQTSAIASAPPPAPPPQAGPSDAQPAASSSASSPPPPPAGSSTDQ